MHAVQRRGGNNKCGLHKGRVQYHLQGEMRETMRTSANESPGKPGGAASMWRMRIRVLQLLALLALALTVAACGGDEEQSSPAESADKKVIGITIPNISVQTALQ